MMSSNFLQETDTVHSTVNSRTKLNFLEDEKVRLELIISEMEQQIQIQRHINTDLSKTSQLQNNQLISNLLIQNKMLEEHYLRIKKENEGLTSSILIQQQLINESEQESFASFRSYQQKIIELRRLIQLKESYIQNIEGKCRLVEDRTVASTNNVTMLFFNEVEQLKKTISNLSIRNKELQHQNKSLVSKTEKIERKLQLLQALSLKSKITFEEMKNYYQSDHKIRRSAPKKDTLIPLNQRLSQMSIKKLNEAQTRECSDLSYSGKDASLKMLIYKYIIQIQKLKQSLRKTKQTHTFQIQNKAKLAESYRQQQKKTLEISSQLNYYKKSTHDLLNLLAYRRQSLHSKSLEKSTCQKIIDKIKAPQQFSYETQRNTYWKSMKSSLKVEKIKLLQVKRKYNGYYRSLSSTLDYRQAKNDQVDKYFKRNNQKDMKPSKNPEDQFSIMINSPLQENISFIQPKNSRKTFSQWKKESKKGSLFNMTIIQENVL